jgi:hypothetical protein
MKSFIMILVTSVVLSATPAFSLFLGRPNQMAGQDWATRGYNKAAREKRQGDGGRTCSAYKNACMRRGNEVSKCQAAGAECMKTGVYINVYNGRSYAGMVRR